MTTPSTPTRSRPLRLGLLVLVGAMALIVAACGGGDDDASSPEKTSEKRETTTTASSGESDDVASGLLDKVGSQFGDSGFDADVEECLGGSVIDALGEDAATEMTTTSPSSYTSEQLDALTDAFNECVPGDAVAQDLTDSFYTSAGAKTDPSSTVVDCVAGKLDGKTGVVVAEGAKVDAGGTPEFTLQVMDACVPPEDVAALLEQGFIEAGLTDAQASCTASALKGQISVSELAAAGSGGLSAELQSKVETAAQGCR